MKGCPLMSSVQPAPNKGLVGGSPTLQFSMLPCIGAGCAWWNELYERCSVPVIAEELLARDEPKAS